MSLPDPLSDLTTGWLSEEHGMKLWPPTMHSDMQEYLIDRGERSLQKRLLGDYKDGKAFSYFDSGFIREIRYHPVDDNSTICFLKSSSARSQRRNDEDHKVWVAIEKKTGHICSAYCSCFAGYVLCFLFIVFLFFDELHSEFLLHCILCWQRLNWHLLFCVLCLKCRCWNYHHYLWWLFHKLWYL